MGCVAEPEDIDLILTLPEKWDVSAELPPYQYNLVSKRRVKQEYGLEIVVVGEGSVDEEEWVAFFSGINLKWRERFDWPIDVRKGLARIRL